MLTGDQRFAGGKALAVRPCSPSGDGVLGVPELPQALQNLEVLHRMDVAGDRKCERAHMCALQCVGR